MATARWTALQPAIRHHIVLASAATRHGGDGDIDIEGDTSLSSEADVVQAQNVVGSEESRDPFYRYCALLALWRKSAPASDARVVLSPRLAAAASRVGRHEVVLTCVQEWENAGAIVDEPIKAVRASGMLGYRAKALRNLGRVAAAEAEYHRVLDTCEQWKLDVEGIFHTLMFVKFYRNYASQQSLARHWTEKVIARLEAMTRGAALTDERVPKYYGIAVDSLGHIIGRVEHNYDLALKLHSKAFLLHSRIGNKNGMSRSRCHMCMASFRLHGVSSLPALIEDFRNGLRLVEEDPMEERGIGVRSVHLAELLHAGGDRDGARLRLRRAFDVSEMYRDRVCKVKALLLSVRCGLRIEGDAVSELEMAAKAARLGGLITLEVEVLREMVQRRHLWGGVGILGRVVARASEVVDQAAQRAEVVGRYVMEQGKRQFSEAHSGGGPEAREGRWRVIAEERERLWSGLLGDMVELVKLSGGFSGVVGRNLADTGEASLGDGPSDTRSDPHGVASEER